MKKLIFNSVVNNLSIGQTSYNFLHAFYKRGDVDIKFHPIPGSQIDLSGFPKNEEFESKLQRSIETRFEIEPNTPSLKLWHINGAEQGIGGGKKHLFTFHETTDVTPVERAILNTQDSIMASSTESVLNFKRGGVTSKIEMIPLGLDVNTKFSGKDYKFGDVIHWTIMGKVERRKRIIENIKIWLKLYGNSNKHHLSCAIINQFIKPEQFQQILHQITDGKVYHNINFLPYLNCEQVSDFHSSSDIQISVSAAEGWNIPAMSAAAIGRHVVVSKCTAHLDWANDDNAIFVAPSGMTECYDGQFFVKGAPFNQGMYYTFSEEDIIKAYREAESRAKTVNLAGIEMGKRLSYDNTVNLIMKNIFS